MRPRSLLVRLLSAGIVVTGLCPRPAAAQGLGGSLGFGVYRSGNEFQTSPGVGAELVVRWASRSGAGAGLGARLVHSGAEDRAATFIDLRYAPFPSSATRIQPIIGVRAGLFVAEGDFGDDPLMGLQAGPLLGIAVRAGTGVSLTIAGDFGLILDTNLCCGTRRFVPGLQAGVTLH
jgi:hypothetical protein